MKVIVAGGRDFNDYSSLEYALNQLQNSYPNEIIEIVSGNARGADTLGERWAKENNKNIHYFKADWNKFGKSAGYKRNEKMAEFADALIAFWDGNSKGTNHMINLAREYKLKVKVIKY